MKFDDLKIFLKSLDKFVWKTRVDDKVIFDLAKKYYKSLKKWKTKGKNFIRIIGQSGSGKTTLLLPPAKSWFKKNKKRPIHFCVRKFAKFHPDYENLVKKFGSTNIREKTNGFALKFLCICLLFAVEEGYDILLEMTFLEKNFEKFLLWKIQNRDYRICFLCSAINKKISNKLITLRQSKKGREGGRKVYKSSSSFFYKNLKSSIKFISKNYKNLKIIIWSFFNEKPVYAGDFFYCLPVFMKYLKEKSKQVLNIKQLKMSRINYIIKLSEEELYQVDFS